VEVAVAADAPATTFRLLAGVTARLRAGAAPMGRQETPGPGHADGSVEGADRPRALALLMAGAAAAALLISLGAPIATVVIGLVLFGVLHSFLEIRYLTGRFSSILSRSFLELLAALVTCVVICRLLVPVLGRPAQLAEIALGYAVLAVGAQRGLSGGRKVAVWVALVPAAAASLAWPAYHAVVLAQLHGLVPLVFLWEWATRIRSVTGRRLFRAVQVVWAIGVPLVILLGAFDGWLSADPGIVRSLVGDGAHVVAATAPPGEVGTLVGLRLVTVFAFLQAMQYVVWVAFMPRYAQDASAAFEARVPWLTGARVWAVGFIVAAVFAVIFVFDYAQGRTLYAALASYSGYLEFPVLLALLVGGYRLGDSAAGRRDRKGLAAPFGLDVRSRD
jgi:hypothetical protein